MFTRGGRCGWEFENIYVHDRISWGMVLHWLGRPAGAFHIGVQESEDFFSRPFFWVVVFLMNAEPC